MSTFIEVSVKHRKNIDRMGKMCLKLSQRWYIYNRDRENNGFLIRLVSLRMRRQGFRNYAGRKVKGNIMRFNIIGRKITVTEKMRDHIEKKLSKLEKFFRDEAEARVVVGTIKDNEYIEASIYAAGMIYRAECTDIDVFTATDKIVDVIERQIRKNKTRLEKKIKRDALDDLHLLSGKNYTDGEDSTEFKIVKKKRFQVKPMSAEEAVLQMNLLGHTFFVFKNQDTEEMNVVYKRKDGNYAIIESV